MKIEVKSKEQSKKYPWLGIDDDGDICLFTEKNKGITIFMDDEKPHGDIDINNYDYTEENFKPFNGTITLSNY